MGPAGCRECYRLEIIKHVANSVRNLKVERQGKSSSGDKASNRGGHRDRADSSVLSKKSVIEGSFAMCKFEIGTGYD